MLRWTFAALVLLAACDREPENDRVPPLEFATIHPAMDAGAHADATTTLPEVPRSGEACGNGIDDDGNGVVDDGCICRPGERQQCYPGDERFAGVGVCAFGWSVCADGDAGDNGWGACLGAVLPADDEIRNGFDDDCDGQIDEGFDTVDPGDTCYAGSPATLNVGPCRAGTPGLRSLDPDDPTPTVRDPSVCTSQVLPSVEICDGIDNDCNGAVDDIVERCDGVDNDCDGVVDNGCPPPTSTVLARFTPQSGSGVYRGDHASMLQAEDLPGRGCSAGEIAVELRDHSILCVEPPPACPPGQQLDYDHGWHCVPCAVVIQFGYLYAGERVCAEMPQLTCPPGQVATFVESNRRWECAPQCNNGEYDRSSVDGVQICIPC